VSTRRELDERSCQASILLTQTGVSVVKVTMPLLLYDEHVFQGRFGNQTDPSKALEAFFCGEVGLVQLLAIFFGMI